MDAVHGRGRGILDMDSEPSYGLLSYALDSIGIEPGLMLGDPGMALWLLVLVTAWWSFSYATVKGSVPRLGTGPGYGSD